MPLASSVRVASGGFKRASKALLSLKPSALSRIKTLLAQPPSTLARPGQPCYLKIGLKSKGCSGSAYTLDYVAEKAPLDEVVEQDGVQILVDSKALLSIIGSEIDYVEDKLSSQFIFYNPNVKETCGCGQSFMS